MVTFLARNKLSLAKMEYLNSLEPLLRTFWFIALPVSLIFTIQTILTFIGLDGSDGLDADFDADMGDGDGGGSFFSLRNLINFLIGFSWSGILFYEDISSKALLVFVAVLIGLAFVALFFFAMKQVKKLAEDNTFDIYDCRGKLAEVYLRIPPDYTGKGKVLVSVKGSTHELQAVTKSLEQIETGTMVRVIAIEDESILKVEKIK